LFTFKYGVDQDLPGFPLVP